MAWVPNQLIQNWFTSWTSNGTNITLPIASMPQLTAAEADTTTGDIRRFLFALIERCWVKWNSIAVADRCTNMTLQKSAYVNTATGVTTYTYTFVFNTVTSAEEVVAEA